MNGFLPVFLLVLTFLRATAQSKTAIPGALTCAGDLESESCYGCMSKCSMSIIRCGFTCNSKGWEDSYCQVRHSYRRLVLLTQSPPDIIECLDRMGPLPHQGCPSTECGPEHIANRASGSTFSLNRHAIASRTNPIKR